VLKRHSCRGGLNPHHLAYDREKFMICYVTVVPIDSVFIRVVRRHAVRSIEAKLIGHVGDCQRVFHDDGFILAPLKILEFYDNLHIGLH